MNAKLRVGLIATLIVGLVVFYQLRDSTLKQRGGLADLYFQTMSDEVLAEVRLSLSEATQSSTRTTVVGHTSGGMGETESHLSWEICTQNKNATENDLNQVAEDTRPKLMQEIEYQEKVLRWYYPNAQINFNLSVTNSGVFHKPAVALSLNCNT